MRMAALVASYSKIQVTSSYLLHPDHPNLWRPFTSWEASRILDIPEDFEFTESISETKRMYMIGNGVDCRVVKAIGIEVSYHLMMSRLGTGSHPAPTPKHMDNWMSVDTNGQYSFVLGV